MTKSLMKKWLKGSFLSIFLILKYENQTEDFSKYVIKSPNNGSISLRRAFLLTGTNIDNNAKN